MEHIPTEAIVNAVIVIISVLAGWLGTRLKRANKELPAPAQVALDKLGYESLKKAYDWAETNAWTPEARQKAAAEQLKKIAADRGIPLPDSVTNLLVEMAVQAAKSGWTVLQKRF